MNEAIFSAQELQWLKANPEIAVSFEEALEDSQNTNPLENGEPDEVHFLRAVIAAQITINAAVKNIITGPYDKLHLEMVNKHITNNKINRLQKFWQLFTFHCACFYDEDNSWCNERLYMEAMREMIRMLEEGEFEMMAAEHTQVANLNTGTFQQIKGEGVNAQFVN